MPTCDGETWRNPELQRGARGQVLGGAEPGSVCLGWGVGTQGRKEGGSHLCPSRPQVPGPGGGCWPPALLQSHQWQQPDRGASSTAVRSLEQPQSHTRPCPSQTTSLGSRSEGAAQLLEKASPAQEWSSLARVAPAQPAQPCTPDLGSAMDQGCRTQAPSCIVICTAPASHCRKAQQAAAAGDRAQENKRRPNETGAMAVPVIPATRRQKQEDASPRPAWASQPDPVSK